MPNFFAALVLMYFFSIRLGWFPVITSDNISIKSGAADTDSCNLHGIQIYQTGESNDP